jgi:carboxymethylenebutenolidase
MDVMETQVVIPTPDGAADGFLYTPKSDEAQASWPAAIHLVDIGGIRDSHRGMAKRLAGSGYVVLLPNVFYRVGKAPFFPWPPKMDDANTMQKFGQLRESLPPDAVVRDGEAFASFLSQQTGVRSGPLGVVGYCFTGAMAMRFAASQPDKFAAAASFHGGRLYTDEPTSPHTLLPHIKSSLYFGHAVEDRSMPKEAIEKFEHALAAWGGQYESETYAGAHHGWTVSDGPSYNQPQAERAFEKLNALFAATLK